MILNESNPLLYILNAFQILHNNTCFDCIQWSEFKLGAYRKRRQLFFDKETIFIWIPFRDIFANSSKILTFVKLLLFLFEKVF